MLTFGKKAPRVHKEKRIWCNLNVKQSNTHEEIREGTKDEKTRTELADLQKENVKKATKELCILKGNDRWAKERKKSWKEDCFHWGVLVESLCFRTLTFSETKRFFSKNLRLSDPDSRIRFSILILSQNLGFFSRIRVTLVQNWIISAEFRHSHNWHKARTAVRITGLLFFSCSRKERSFVAWTVSAKNSLTNAILSSFV